MDNDVYVNLDDLVFHIPPTRRFAKKMKVEPNFWEDMYRKKKFWGYSNGELQEWFEFKTKGRKINSRAVDRWIARQEVFNTAQSLIKKGEKTAHIKLFGNHVEVQNYLKAHTITHYKIENFGDLIQEENATQ